MNRPLPLLSFLCVACLVTGCSASDSPSSPANDAPSPPDAHAAIDDVVAVDFVRDPAPAHDGIYSFAHGCYAVEAFDGVDTLRYLAVGADEASFAFSESERANAVSFHMRASDLGMYLFYDSERTYFTAEESTGDEGEAWRFTRPDTLESIVDRLDASFKSPAEWHLEPSIRDPDRFQLKHRATEAFLTLAGLSADASQAAIVTLYPAEGCVEFPELGLDATGAVKPRTWDDGDLYGIAEIHSHMMADSGFGGGGVFHGAPFHRLGVERALPDCDRSHGPDGRRDLVGFFEDQGVGFSVEALLPVVSNGEFEEFNHTTAGYPEFTDWPNSWRHATHQTMYYRWLERAYLSGLRLLVQHATGNSVLCDLTVGTGAQQTLYSCNDMVSVDQAIAQAHALERYVDAQAGGPGKGWFRVVESPKEARDVINQGKMAVVLGIEISNLFDCFLTPKEGFEECTPEVVKAKLDHYHDQGVRVIFPVHKYDNAFSPGDGSSGIIELGNFINSGHYGNFVEECASISSAFDGGGVTFGGLNMPRDTYNSPAPEDMSGFVDDIVGTLLPFYNKLTAPALEGEYCQKHGLTPLGEFLIHELMSRGILIDIAHLPQHALSETYVMLEENDYPATKTHGNSNDGRIYAIGGLVGSGFNRCADPEKPGTMGQRLTSSVASVVAKGGYPSEALSFDLNGFAGGPRPRFGDDKACGKPQANPLTYPFQSFDGDITFEQPFLGNRQVDFNTEGMIHIGLLPELIEDVRRDGMSDDALEPLFRSAEAYVRMWEKAEKRSKTIESKVD
jgi:microsomal dipeptidase-like Zn-dependent dipeptidase